MVTTWCASGGAAAYGCVPYTGGALMLSPEASIDPNGLTMTQTSVTGAVLRFVRDTLPDLLRTARGLLLRSTHCYVCSQDPPLPLHFPLQARAPVKNRCSVLSYIVLYSVRPSLFLSLDRSVTTRPGSWRWSSARCCCRSPASSSRHTASSRPATGCAPVRFPGLHHPMQALPPACTGACSYHDYATGRRFRSRAWLLRRPA